MSQPLPPLTFQPLLHERVWGGRRLERLGKPLPPGRSIGESWEIADLPPEVAPAGRSIIAVGRFAGISLHELIREYPESVLGRGPGTARGSEPAFPLLIKYLDAEANLSVQVHPDASYAASHPGAHLKSEAWVIIDAEPGSLIYKGLREPLSPERLRAAALDGSIAEHLQAVPAIVGECHYLPSGTCHALGAGVLVAEVQTPSDTTFRLYDWGRTGRTLHIDEALSCIDPAAPPPPAATRLKQGTYEKPDVLCRTEHFEIRAMRIEAGERHELQGAARPIVWMVLAGRGVVQSEQSGQLELLTGSTVLFPARLNACEVRFDEDSWMLRVEPSGAKD